MKPIPSWALSFPSLRDSLQLASRPCPWLVEADCVVRVEQNAAGNIEVVTLEIIAAGNGSVDAVAQQLTLDLKGEVIEKGEEVFITVSMVESRGCARGFNMPATVQTLIAASNRNMARAQ